MRLSRHSVVLAAVLTLTAVGACSGPAAPRTDQPAGQPADPSAEPAATAGLQGNESAPAAAKDIRAVDLRNTPWLYSAGGVEVPLALTLVDGQATVQAAEGAARFEFQDVAYGDVDGDGDDDAVASISRSGDNTYERLWYLWLLQDQDAMQVKYPIAQSGKCGTAVDSVVPGQGRVEITQRLRQRVVDDRVPCSEPGTGLQQRTITVHTEGEQAWPVQTAPIPAWGGICPGSPWPDSEPGLVNLWSAPTQSAPVAAITSPEGGSVFAVYPSPLMLEEGWAFVGFTQRVDVGDVKLHCAFGGAA